MDLVEQPVGPEGTLSVKLEAGKIVLTFSHVHASGDVSVVAKEDAKYFLEKLKVAIPGNWDDLVINALEGIMP
jgi:hypothetical protein